VKCKKSSLLFEEHGATSYFICLCCSAFLFFYDDAMKFVNEELKGKEVVKLGMPN